MSNDRYVYRVEWSPEDEGYLGLVAEFPSLSWFAESQLEAFLGIQTLVAEVLEDMTESGEEPPKPLKEKTYSGRFQMRVPPELHRRLSIEAAEQNVSLNRLAANRLANGR